MASCSPITTLITWKRDLKAAAVAGSSISVSRKAAPAAVARSSVSNSRKAAAGSTISISRKAAAGSTISISHKGTAGSPILKAAARTSGGCGARATSVPVDESVIRRWSLPLPSRTSPWLMLPPAFEGVYQFYSLAANKVLSFNKTAGEELPDPHDSIIVGSSHGWLAFFNRRNGNLFLSNPLSGRHIKLPPIHTLPTPQVCLWRCALVSKVIISCSPDQEECRAMMIYGEADRLAFCVPGRSTEWTPIGAPFHKFENADHKYARVYEDFIYSSRHKLFICITEFIDDHCYPDYPMFDMEGWDLGDPQFPCIDWMENSLELYSGSCPWSREQLELLQGSEKMQYLVFAEHANELFIVIRYIRYNYDDNDNSFPYKTIAFDVLKVDREAEKARYTSNGPAMFIGTNHSFALSAAEFPELKPNSIYFTDAYEFVPRDWHTYGGCHDIGIYNYENNTLCPCYYPACDVQSIKRSVPVPVWFTASQY